MKKKLLGLLNVRHRTKSRVMMNNRRLLQLQRRQCEGAESAGGKTELSADALSDTLPFGVKFFVCFEAKRNHDSKLT